MSKILEKLIDKAEVKGTASVNGRMYDPSTGGYSELREKWAIDNDGKTLTLWHWGTRILKISLLSENILYFRSYSTTDTTAINFIMQHYGYSKIERKYKEFARFFKKLSDIESK